MKEVRFYCDKCTNTMTTEDTQTWHIEHRKETDGHIVYEVKNMNLCPMCHEWMMKIMERLLPSRK